MSDDVLVSRAELARLRKIEDKAKGLVRLLDAESSAQAKGQQDRAASPGREAPPRAAVVDAERELREAVR